MSQRRVQIVILCEDGEADCKPYVENLVEQCRSQNLSEQAPLLKIMMQFLCQYL